MAINVVSSSAAGSGEAATQPDPIKDFDFGSAHEAAMNYGEPDTPSGETGTEQVETQPEVQAEPEAEGQVETQGEVTDVNTASDKKLATLGDDDLVEVEVDGEKVTIPWKDAKGGVMRQAAFTKRMQEVAAQRKEIEGQQAAVRQLREEREALAQLLRDPNLLGQFIDQKYPQLRQTQAKLEEAAEAVDPGDIATVAQIQAARNEFANTIKSLVQALETEQQRREEVVVQRIQDAQEVVRLQGEIRTTIDGLFETAPYIKKVIPNAEDMLRYEVAKLAPQTPAEVLSAFKQVFEGWVESYKTTVQETSKRSVIEKHKLQQNNIQPPGGAKVQPQPQSYMTKTRSGKTDVDWNALHKTALEMMNKK